MIVTRNTFVSATPQLDRTFNQLPHDLQLKLFALLDLSDVLRFSVVCRDCYQFAVRLHIWKIFEKNLFQFYSEDELSQYKSLKALEFTRESFMNTYLGAKSTYTVREWTKQASSRKI